MTMTIDNDDDWLYAACHQLSAVSRNLVSPTSNFQLNN